MQTINITEAKAKFSEVVDRVISGEEIIVTRMNNPVIKITPYHKNQQHNRLGALTGQIKISDDFDEWSDEELDAFHMS